MESFLNRLYGFDKAKVENRKYVRFPLTLAAECHYKTREKSQECRIVDICQRGIGFEIDSCIEMRHGQNVLLSIQLPTRKNPISAIVKLQWIKTPGQGAPKQRLGSRLLFIDPKDKAHLLQHAHSSLLMSVAKAAYTARAMDLRYPKIRDTKD